MLIPIGPVRNLPITLYHVATDPPRRFEGQIVHFDGRGYSVRLLEPFPEALHDQQLLVDLSSGSSGRRRARIVPEDDDVYYVELLGRPRRHERREFPRMEGRIHLEFFLVPQNDLSWLERWVAHPHVLPADIEWLDAEMSVEFSVTGFRFTTDQPVPPGTLLGIRFKLIRQAPKRHLCGAEVVRLDEDEQPGRYRVAVALLSQDPTAVDALMHYTRSHQDEVLGLDNDPSTSPDAQDREDE